MLSLNPSQSLPNFYELHPQNQTTIATLGPWP